MKLKNFKINWKSLSMILIINCNMKQKKLMNKIVNFNKNQNNK